MNAANGVKGKQSVQKNYVNVKVCDELYAIIAREADATGKKLIDVVVKAIAESFNRPELGYVPRANAGRPRQKALAEAS